MEHFIVRFRQYANMNIHERYVDATLKPTPFLWRLCPRVKRSLSIPTDFVVIATPHPGALALLLDKPFIRGIHVDSRAVPRATLSAPSSSSKLGAGTLHLFGSGALWARGYTGGGVRVAVFDTGLASGLSAIANVAERTDWTGEGVVDDAVGHGTFVAGLIGGRHTHCPGLAPDAILYAMRVFTGAQTSYTSWFLDAFNYAMHVGVDVLNLSIGGPDFADAPFVDKIHELAAAGVVVVSAIGNDGPAWGSLNNPGDMLDVVGVGAAEPDGAIARFSSRGGTTRYLASPTRSYGTVKPDVVAYARALVAPSNTDVSTCKSLSGTSVASPVVAGAVALIISAVPHHRRRRVATPAAVKRALMHSAKLLPRASMYEQGAGLLDITTAVDVMLQIDAEYMALLQARTRLEQSAHDMQVSQVDLQRFSRALHAAGADAHPSNFSRVGQHWRRRLRFAERVVDSGAAEDAGLYPGPRVYLFPDHLDLTTASCALMWPHCAQPLHESGEAHTVNISILNPVGAHAEIVDTTWTAHLNGDLVNVTVSLPDRFWPWGAGLALHFDIVRNVQDPKVVIEGTFRVVVVTIAERAYSVAELAVRLEAAPNPPRSKRVLWDVFHSVRYPPGYVPRDSLKETKDLLDWLGDHPHTNFRALYAALRRHGYFVDVLDRPLSCLGQAVASQYGVLLVMDSEDYFFASERALIHDLVHKGLTLFVAAEWHDTSVMADICFDDDNTRSRWTPIIGGGNTHALNQLLAPFNIAFGGPVVSGELSVDTQSMRIESGVPLAKFPSHAELVHAPLIRYRSKAERHAFHVPSTPEAVPILGIAFFGRGALIALGDTYGLDGSATGAMLFLALLRHVTQTPQPRRPLFSASSVLRNALNSVIVEDERAAKAAFGLFVPHSRVLRVDATRDRLQTRDDALLCKQYDARRSLARTLNYPSSANRRAQFPRRARARLVGSETHYYGAMRERVHMDSQEDDGHGGTNSSSGARRAAIVIAAAVGIVVGVAFMTLAIVAPLKRRPRRWSTRDLRASRYATLRSALLRMVGSSSRDE